MDTNAIQDYLQELYPQKGLDKMDKILEYEANISVITQIEVLSYEPESVIFAQKLQNFISESVIFDLDEAVIQQTITNRKQYRLKLGDAIIAATAQLHNFTIVTNNERDFNRILGLRMLNPYKL